MSEEDETMSESEESSRGADDNPGTDDVLLLEEDGHDENDESGLALDDAQAEEIRRVFLTTLPQYLEPVEQMVEQLFTSEHADEDTRKALDTTLSSIADAASRIGVDEIRGGVTRIREELAQLDDESHPPRARIREEILAAVEEIKGIASGTGEPAAKVREGPGSQTIFKALEGLEGIDRSVLQQMTAAGLVTVDQLTMARPDEIVAVTGLDESVVQKILASLLDAEAPPRQEAEAASVRQAAAVPAPEAGAPLRQGAKDGLEADLSAKLRGQVEAEAALNEVRVEVQRLRALVASRRGEVVSAERKRDDQRATLDRLRDRLADRLTALGEARAGRDELDSKLIDNEEALRHAEQRIAKLREQRQELLEDEARSAQEVADLVQRVERLLDSPPTHLQGETPHGRPWRR
jgi:hypothetical protein